jgi:tRNA(Ile)-lysidine synthase
MPKILFKKKIRILRPLLDLKKKEIIKYLKEKKVNWIEDPTNVSSKYSRNRLRKILPKLEKKGLTDNKLKKILKRAQKERKKIENKLADWLNKYVDINSLGYALINFSSLKLLNKDDFIFIFSRILNMISGSFYVPKSKYVYNFYKKIKSNETINHSNLGGCHIFFFKKRLYVCREIFKKDRKQKINFQFNKIVWDNRFEIEQKKNKNFLLKKELGKSVFIEQLQKDGWNEILLKNEKLKKEFMIPNKIILSLPAIKNKKSDVLYVPHLNYYSNVKSKKEFSNINFLFKPDVALSNIY